MNVKEHFRDAQDRLNEWLDLTKDYFSNLNEQEKYGWMGEGVGFVLLLAGTVLLIV